jgi:hypothetical protein
MSKNTEHIFSVEAEVLSDVYERLIDIHNNECTDRRKADIIGVLLDRVAHVLAEVVSRDRVVSLLASKPAAAINPSDERTLTVIVNPTKDGAASKVSELDDDCAYEVAYENKPLRGLSPRLAALLKEQLEALGATVEVR